MARNPVRRPLALLLLTLAVSAGPAAAVASRRAQEAGSTGSLWSSPVFWQGLAASIPYLGEPLTRLLKSGRGVETAGRPLGGVKTTDYSGCGIDPNGRPPGGATAAETDRGCGIDPNGQPLCGSH